MTEGDTVAFGTGSQTLAHSFLTIVSQVRFEIFSHNIFDKGKYDIVLNALLDDSYYGTVTSNSVNTWELELIDVCLQTIIND